MYICKISIIIIIIIIILICQKLIRSGPYNKKLSCLSLILYFQFFPQSLNNMLLNYKSHQQIEIVTLLDVQGNFHIFYTHPSCAPFRVGGFQQHTFGNCYYFGIFVKQVRFVIVRKLFFRSQIFKFSCYHFFGTDKLTQNMLDVCLLLNSLHV